MKTELVTTLKRQAMKLLKELREEKEPVLITEHGKPSAYLVDVDQFEHLSKEIKTSGRSGKGRKKLFLKIESFLIKMPKSAWRDGSNNMDRACTAGAG